MGERPKRYLVHVVDEAIAIGTNKGEISSRLDQKSFSFRPLSSSFAEACRVTDNTTRAHRIEFLKRLDGSKFRNSEKHSVWRLRQLVNGCKAGMVTNVGAFRVHRPKRTRKANALAFGCYRLGVAPADYRHVARL